MKRSLLTGFRALAFALGAFTLVAISGIRIRSTWDVAAFVLGLAIFWVVIEKLFVSIAVKRRKATRGS